MSIGYACKTVAATGTGQKSLVRQYATEARLHEVMAGNIEALDKVMDYLDSNDIRLFRISSDIIPFGSSPVNTIHWQRQYSGQLAAVGRKALARGIRLSMHPGQYTVLNSPDEGVVCRAMEDLQYHCDFLDSLGLPASHKIILHVGGVYGEREAAVNRFVQASRQLPQGIKKRLVIENDDRCYTVEEVLAISRQTGLPAVFDNLHHQLNPPPTQKSDREWIDLCGQSWRPEDGKQKIHYSQQAAGGKAGAHSATVAVAEFAAYYHQINGGRLDVMLEVKDKNRSAVKCGLCVGEAPMARLEREWGRYKYLVMEHDLRSYQQLRQLLKDKSSCPALEMFSVVEAALEGEVQPGSAVNAANHVWGYFKRKATKAEAGRFSRALDRYRTGQGGLNSVKNALRRLAEGYEESYLLESYYFDF